MGADTEIIFAHPLTKFHDPFVFYRARNCITLKQVVVGIHLFYFYMDFLTVGWDGILRCVCNHLFFHLQH